MEKYILSLDSGTTSNRAILFDHSGKIVESAQKEFDQIFPQSGWVEHEPELIWKTLLQVARDVMRQHRVDPSQIAGIGITNQRETTIVWDRKTGVPVYNAIVWQDRRTAGFCNELKEKGLEKTITEKTGLLIDAYFSATKIRWILDHVEGAQHKAKAGELLFGTVDSWLVWKLTGGKLHITDITNASRTLLFNIHTLRWDKELLSLFDIPAEMLPEVKPSSQLYGLTEAGCFESAVPIAGIAGDQQAALFGQMCTDKGMVKNTYGTGCFVVMNTGEKPVVSKNKLLTTIGWQIGNEVTYALEGSIFIGGAVVQWLRDQLGIIRSSSEIEALASEVENNGGVTFVQGFVGLGAPHWDQYATGTIIGLTRGTGKAHIARAALEAIAFRSMEVIETMVSDSGIELSELRVDGGAAVNNLLMQIQADAIGRKVVRPKITETTALGAAYFAGLAVGYWKNIDELKEQWQVDRKFIPRAKEPEIEKTIANWKKAIMRAKNWNNPV
ncbi:glycerol kinase GlpK [Proteiniphilum sp. X52]|uniref:glycerol kinase GlpK n=1 Tax=Proteiniphilum sp. X52 TaxID=2382159 RepID=UPI000F09C4C8|nr:glycerol kinase GlpK [Proteiniphilum sp. X52]RNC66150.1 glycerol kinase [Proteiniphilum sp. X52]